MYDREIAGETLEFEASGALLDASLVMRDRQTDSWWSIMTSDSIGGSLEGSDLVELPIGKKVQWRDWVAEHPGTEVLSIAGREHVERNPYEGYFESDDTFRDLEVNDQRLRPKDPIFSFRLDEEPFAVAQVTVEGGRVFRTDAGVVLIFRPEGASQFASTEAWVVEGAVPPEGEPAPATTALVALAQAGDSGFTPLVGFDTFWYSWVAVNEDTTLLE